MEAERSSANAPELGVGAVLEDPHPEPDPPFFTGFGAKRGGVRGVRGARVEPCVVSHFNLLHRYNQDVYIHSKFSTAKPLLNVGFQSRLLHRIQHTSTTPTKEEGVRGYLDSPREATSSM
jgi:hypothetical protein